MAATCSGVLFALHKFGPAITSGLGQTIIAFNSKARQEEEMQRAKAVLEQGARVYSLALKCVQHQDLLLPLQNSIEILATLYNKIDEEAGLDKYQRVFGGFAAELDVKIKQTESDTDRILGHWSHKFATEPAEHQPLSGDGETDGVMPSRTDDADAQIGSRSGATRWYTGDSGWQCDGWQRQQRSLPWPGGASDGWQQPSWSGDWSGEWSGERPGDGFQCGHQQAGHQHFAGHHNSQGNGNVQGNSNVQGDGNVQGNGNVVGNNNVVGNGNVVGSDNTVGRSNHRWQQ